MERLSLVPPPLADDELARVSAVAGSLVAACARAVVAPKAVLQACVVCLLAGGHLMIEDVPGVGKTVLAKSLARAAGCRFARLQCTADLLPSDVTGVSIFNQRTQSFEFRPGPVFANVLLVDEINRASPKTQSALLECMEEGQVTVDGVSRPLPRPFMVIATQNPVEYEGTYPLPEAQLDRFTLRLSIGYPTPDQEAAMLLELSQPGRDDPADRVQAVSGEGELAGAADAVGRIHADPALARYVVELVVATRGDRRLTLGASPRAGLSLLKAAKAMALLDASNHVRAEDVKALAPMVLAHRLLLAPEARAQGVEAGAIVAEALSRVPVPLA